MFFLKIPTGEGGVRLGAISSGRKSRSTLIDHNLEKLSINFSLIVCGFTNQIQRLYQIDPFRLKREFA